MVTYLDSFKQLPCSQTDIQLLESPIPPTTLSPKIQILKLRRTAEKTPPSVQKFWKNPKQNVQEHVVFGDISEMKRATYPNGRAMIMTLQIQSALCEGHTA